MFYAVSDGLLRRPAWCKTGTTYQRANRVATSAVLGNRVDTATQRGSPDSTTIEASQKYRQFDDQWNMGYSFDADPIPEGCWLEVVAGQLPKELEGTYFRVGPGRFRAGSEEYGHPLDGDGLVTSVALKGGRAFFRSRFVETPELRAEEAVQKVLFRGSFAAQRAGGWMANAMNMHVKNSSNTNVLPFGDHLLSYFEAGLPYRLDPTTLKTKGLETLGGRVRPGMPVAMHSGVAALLSTMSRVLGDNHLLPPEYMQPGGHACTAHPCIDPVSGRLCLFTYQIDSSGVTVSGNTLTFWELEPGTGNAYSKLEYPMPGTFFVHDFVMTANYYIIFQAPMTMDILPFLLGQKAPSSCFHWAPATPSYIHLLPRPGSDAAGLDPSPRTFSAPPTFVFHHINAYEEVAPFHSRSPAEPPTDSASAAVAAARGPAPATVLVVDSIHYDSLPPIAQQPLQQVECGLRRTTINLATGDVSLSPPGENLEFPNINRHYAGSSHRFIYGHTTLPSMPSQAIIKVDTATAATSAYHPPPSTFIGEPTLVPRPGATAEDDGWLVAMSFDLDRRVSEVLVLDAQSIESGPVAVLAVPRPLPHGLHGSWSPVYYGPTPAM